MNPETLRAILALLQKFGRTEQTQPAPVMPAMEAQPPANPYNFRTTALAPELVTLLSMPFVRDTLYPALAVNPTIGMVDDSTLPSRVRYGASAFVDTKVPTRISFTEEGIKAARRSHTTQPELPLSEILTHEVAHVMDATTKDPEVKRLRMDLRRIYDETVVHAKGSWLAHYKTLAAASDPREHFAYSIELAMDMLRQGIDPNTDHAAWFESIVPGTFRALEYLKSRIPFAKPQGGFRELK